MSPVSLFWLSTNPLRLHMQMAPLKALTNERWADWQPKLAHLGIKSVELTGDSADDEAKQQEIENADLILTTQIDRASRIASREIDRASTAKSLSLQTMWPYTAATNAATTPFAATAML